MDGWAAFHFLRPGWLWLLLPMGALLWAISRGQDPQRNWRKLIDPQLLRHLIMEPQKNPGRLRPLWLLAVAWLIAVFALSGPSWQKEPTPFSEDQSGLFIVLKVTPDMLAQDVQPSRLERAVQKIGELLESRPDTRTGLIAYAGSAHLVMPLTSDANVVRYFASALEPDIMPNSGDDPVQAVELAARRLSVSGLAGSILLLADAVDPSNQEGLARVHEQSGVAINVYAMAAGDNVVPPPDSPPAQALDEVSMAAAARAGGGRMVRVTADGADIAKLGVSLERSLATAPAQQGERWRDTGYYLLWLLIVIVPIFWRRGGGVILQA